MNTLNFPDKDLIEEQAASWIAAIDRGVSASEEATLGEWLSESALHGDALVRLASMWDLMDVLTPISTLLPIEQNAESNVHSQGERVDDSGSDRNWFAIAASVSVIAVGLVAGIASFDSENVKPQSQQLNAQKSEPESVSQTQTYITAVGEQSNITLSDGSEVKLNTDSAVSVRFSNGIRQVKLDRGEAFFDVAKNPNRPFVVITERGRVTAVGTAFSVDASHLEDLEVLVAEGRVKVERLNSYSVAQSSSESSSEIGNSVYLDKGQRVLITSQQTTVSSNQDVESELAWRKGMIVFTGEPLHQAVAEIDRYIPLDFKIVDQQIASIPVGGFFKTGDLDQLLLILENNFGVVSTREGNSIFLSKAPE